MYCGRCWLVDSGRCDSGHLILSGVVISLFCAQLYKYDLEKGFGDTLVEEDCYNDEKLAAFLA